MSSGSPIYALFGGSVWGGIILEELCIALALLGTTAAYKLYRKYKPHSPEHHERFIVIAIMASFLACILSNSLVEKRQFIDFMTVDIPPLAISLVIAFGFYKLALKFPKTADGIFLVVRILLGWSTFLLFAIPVIFLIWLMAHVH